MTYRNSEKASPLPRRSLFLLEPGDFRANIDLLWPRSSAQFQSLFVPWKAFSRSVTPVSLSTQSSTISTTAPLPRRSTINTTQCLWPKSTPLSPITFTTKPRLMSTWPCKRSDRQKSANESKGTFHRIWSRHQAADRPLPRTRKKSTPTDS